VEITQKYMMKGNEKDCICEKPKGKHRKYCDAFRLSEFFKKMVGCKKDTVITFNGKLLTNPGESQKIR
jgi:hypothetical protein